jgi:ribosomal protein S18 acetylase RimI-like enzyme
MTDALAIGMFIFALFYQTLAFHPIYAGSRRQISSSVTGSATADPSLNIITFTEDDETLIDAATFMVDSFWLGSDHQVIGDVKSISINSRSKLIQEQAYDLSSKYAERMGKRLLDSRFLIGTNADSGIILGVVGVETTLYDKGRKNILSVEKAEEKLKHAISSLGPKERRAYKDSTVEQVAKELLSPDYIAICCLSNLAVRQELRGRGIALQLCTEAERVAAEWKYNSIFLKVEVTNTAARSLYEMKLNYLLESTIESASAMRVQADTGALIEVDADTLILKKKL